MHADDYMVSFMSTEKDDALQLSFVLQLILERKI